MERPSAIPRKKIKKKYVPRVRAVSQRDTKTKKSKKKKKKKSKQTPRVRAVSQRDTHDKKLKSGVRCRAWATN